MVPKYSLKLNKQPNMPKLRKQQEKNIYRKHLSILLLFLIFVTAVLLIFLIKNRQDFIYPSLHRDQPSPKKFVEIVVQQLPPVLVKPEVIEHGSRNKHQVALTFDADMTVGMLGLLQKHFVKSWYNYSVKQTLDREGVKATVFLGGLWAKTYPNETKDLSLDPLIEIGNHSYSHPAFAKNCFKLPVIDDNQTSNEVLSAQLEIEKITGSAPKYFRFPGGCYEKIDVETIAKLGLKIIHWDVVANDGFNQNTGSIVRKVESGVQNGSIVVFHIHDGPYAPKTNDALVKIIPDLKKQGYQFVTISELLAN